MSGLASINIKFAADLAGFSTGMQNANRKIAKMGKSLQRVGSKLSVGLTAPIIGIGAVALKSAADLETMEVSFESMLGSAEKAKKLTEDLINFTASTPFQLEGVSDATRQLLSFGVAEEDVLSKLKILGDISAGAKIPLSDMASIFGKIQAKGKAMTEEILQMSDRGIPIIDVLANQFGVAKTEIFKMASQGKISFKSVEKGLESMTVSGGIFNDQMAKQSNTLYGLYSTIKDNLIIGFAELGKEITKTFNLKKLAKQFISSIKGLVLGFKNLEPAIKKVIIVIASLVATIGPLLVALGLMMTTVVPGLITVFGGLKLAVLLAVDAFELLRLLIIANPWTALAVAVASVAGYFIFFNKESQKTIKNQTVLQQVNEKASSSIVKQKAKLQELLFVARNENVIKSARIKAIQELNKISPKYLGNLTLETINTDAAANAVKLYNEELLKTARIKAAQEKLQDIQSKLIEIQLKAERASVANALELKNIREDEGLSLAQKTNLIKVLLNVTKTLVPYGEKQVQDLRDQEILLLSIIGVNTENKKVISATVSERKKLNALSVVNASLDGVNRRISAFESQIDAMKQLQSAYSENSDSFQEYANLIVATQKQIDFIKFGPQIVDIPPVVAPFLEKEKKALEGFNEVSLAIGDSLGQMGDSIVNSLGLASSGLEGFVKGLAQTVTKLITMYLSQSIASSIAGASASGAATGPAAVFTTPGFIATAVSGVLAAFASIPKFEHGGVVGGSSFSGDKLFARVNSGEMILNNRQQNNLSRLISPASQEANIVLLPSLDFSGDKFRVMLKRVEKRNSRIK